MRLPHRSGVWAHSRYRAEDPVPPINVCLSSPHISRTHSIWAKLSWEQEKSIKVLGDNETTNCNN